MSYSSGGFNSIAPIQSKEKGKRGGISTGVLVLLAGIRHVKVAEAEEPPEVK